MSHEDFTDEQEMSVHDKDRPTLGPTEGSQDVEGRAREIVPMPAFTDPHNPDAAGGSINLSLNSHPVVHSEDYGMKTAESVGAFEVENTMDEGARTIRENATASSGAQERKAAKNSADLGEAPEDRAEWDKKHWVAQAGALGLATSGNMDTVKGRVEQYEAEQVERGTEVDAAKSLKAEDWKQQIEDAEDEGELQELRTLYDETGLDYTTVASAFDDKAAVFSGADQS